MRITTTTTHDRAEIEQYSATKVISLYEGNIEIENFCTIGLDLKTIFELDPNPQNSLFGPQKAYYNL